MIRIAGANIPNKRLVIALTYIYGIGLTRSKLIVAKAKLDESIRPKDLSEEELNVLRRLVGEYMIEGDLRREVISNVRRLKDIKCYKGIRHGKHLPVRGQKTKTNSRTVRGNKRATMGSGRVKVTKT